MIVPSLRVPDAVAVLRYTSSSKVDTYVAMPRNPSDSDKVDMLAVIAGKLGLNVSIQHFPDLSKEPT